MVRKEKIVKEIKLDNNQTIVISDASRKISEDAYLVKMKAEMEVLVEKELFSEREQNEVFFEDILDKVGKKVIYEYLAERNFIMVKDKDELFEKFVHDFSETLLKYVSKQDFPKKLILKQYKDKLDSIKHTIKAV